MMTYNIYSYLKSGLFISTMSQVNVAYNDFWLIH